MTEVQKLHVNGSVTLPRPIRESLGVNPGEYVLFRTNDDGSVLLRKLKLDGYN